MAPGPGTPVNKLTKTAKTMTTAMAPMTPTQVDRCRPVSGGRVSGQVASSSACPRTKLDCTWVSRSRRPLRSSASNTTSSYPSR